MIENLNDLYEYQMREMRRYLFLMCAVALVPLVFLCSFLVGFVLR